MQSQVLAWFRGYVEVEIRGRNIETLLNEAAETGCPVWGVRRVGEGTVRLYTDLRSFFSWRPLLRRTECKIHVTSRRGLPFWLARMESRLFFMAGMVLFVFGVYLLSQLVWQVEVSGNERIADEEVAAAAEELGIYRFQWKFRLDEPQRLANELMRRMPGTAWIGVEIRGTKVHIRVVEQTVPEPRPLMSPRHLVASADAVVTEILVEQGQVLVRRNMRVKKGDILVSGQIGDEASGRTVVAKGSVKGLVWYAYTIRSPLAHQHKVYTGAEKTRRYLVLGNRALMVWGYGELPFQTYETSILRKQMKWRKAELPFGWIREQLKEVDVTERTVSESEAKNIGLAQARADVLAKAGALAAVRDEKILHEKIEGGKVYMKVLFEVEQEITRELPIVQGE